MKKIFLILFIIVLFIGAFWLIKRNINPSNLPSVIQNIIQPTPSSPLQISYLRSKTYPGSSVKIEETLVRGINYKRYIASYTSDGLKIYGLLTIPDTTPPSGGFPAIIFNHGYITPEKYTPEGNYIAYVDALAKAGYVVFKPDYRGNGKSQGSPTSAYFSNDYDIDDLNAIASVKKMAIVNQDKLGLWGHSMGGHITLVSLEVSSDIKAAVIWSGVVGSYNDILYNWQEKVTYQPDKEDLHLRNLNSQNLVAQYGTPNRNPDFWNSIDPTKNLQFIATPLQLHIGLADTQVPPDFTVNLFNKLQETGKTSQLYQYPGANHDINEAFNQAMARTLSFYATYLK